MLEIAKLAIETAFVVWLFYTTYEIIKLGNHYTDSISKSKNTPNVPNFFQSNSGGFNDPPKVVKSKVYELPPEALAPMLRNPPKSPGGFGSRVRGD
jgi:hypothetical protein